MFKLPTLALCALLCATALISPAAVDAEGSYLWQRPRSNEANSYAQAIEHQHAGNLNGGLFATWEHHYTLGPQTN
ncbi:hypothetical protein N7537_010241 [Penicillium hordei]|uniref:Uncharacterized protein n=1 Tax=Penicillium hordei TaxID=40994 RepID=A0AAD6DVT7_9EURO|nr:uncharacterized protein N7537_010241 [Penicillium hordei]KAJ5593337.1 hypothetical protein N7537_010241 [Penicillium hordei]